MQSNTIKDLVKFTLRGEDVIGDAITILLRCLKVRQIENSSNKHVPYDIAPNMQT